MIEILCKPIDKNISEINKKNIKFYFSNSQDVSHNKIINDKNVQIICFDYNFSVFIKQQWPFDFLKYSFNKIHHSDKNLNLFFFKDINYSYSKNISLLLDLKQKIIQNFFKDPYLFLINTDFIFMDNINKISFNKEIAVSKQIIQDIDMEKTIKHVRLNKNVIEYYINNINKSFNKMNFKPLDFPIYIKNNILSFIIDRWIELSITFYIDKKSPLYKNDFGYLFAFSFACLEFLEKQGCKNLDYFNISVYSNDINIQHKYLIYNYRYILKAYNKTQKREMGFFHKYYYEPWDFINAEDFMLKHVQKLFYTQLSSFIEEKSGIIRPNIKKV